MAGNTMTRLANAFMIKFDDVYIEHVYDKSKLWAMLNAAARKVVLGGRDAQVYWAVRTAHAYAVGAHDEGGDFAQAEGSTDKNFFITPARYNFPFEFTGDVLDYSKDSEYAYIMADAIAQHQMEVLSTQQHFMGHRIHMNGDGIMATTQATTQPQTVIPLNTGINAPGAIWFRKGQHVEIRPQGGGSVQDGPFEVIDVDRINDTITLDSATTTNTLATDEIYLTNTAGKPEVEGLQKLISDTGTVQGIDRTIAGNGFAKSWVSNLGGAALTEVDLRAINNYVADYSPNHEAVAAITTDTDTNDSLFDLIGDKYRFSDKKTNELSFGDMALFTPRGVRVIMTEPYNLPGNIWYLNPTEFVCAWPKGREGGYWYAPSGNTVLPKPGSVAGTSYAESYQGIRVLKYQVGNDDFQAHGRLTNFT